MKVAAIILAAGASSRLGSPKQLVKWNNEFILEKLHFNLSSLLDSTYVVTGCYHQEIEKQFHNMKLIHNLNWQNGMGSSISTAINTLKDDYSHILICVCDQALIKKHHYQKLLNISIQYPNNIISSFYNDSVGVPAIFPKEYFEDLIHLKNSNNGAKTVIQNHNLKVVKILCEEASFDLDTKENLDDLKKIIISKDSLINKVE